MEYVEQNDTTGIPDAFEAKDKITAPYFRVDFDFVLSEETSK